MCGSGGRIPRQIHVRGKAYTDTEEAQLVDVWQREHSNDPLKGVSVIEGEPVLSGVKRTQR